MTYQEYLADAIANVIKSKCGALSWTLERGQGQTYQNDLPTLYAHDEHPASSVLAGSPRRRYVHEFDDMEIATEMLRTIPELQHVEDMMAGGSTHIDLSARVAHLPDAQDDGFFDDVSG